MTTSLYVRTEGCRRPHVIAEADEHVERLHGFGRALHELGIVERWSVTADVAEALEVFGRRRCVDDVGDLHSQRYIAAVCESAAHAARLAHRPLYELVLPGDDPERWHDTALEVLGALAGRAQR